MIRSGGLHFVSNAIRFVPDLEDIPNFEELSRKEAMSSESIEAARILDEVVANLNQNFFDGTQYFQVSGNITNSRAFFGGKHLGFYSLF